MTPGACVQAAIDICAAIWAGKDPADTTLDDYFRARRYAGAKDRRTISRRVYDVLRRRARLDWWIERSGSRLEPGPRSRLIADLALGDKAAPETIAHLFSGTRHCPPPLIPDEDALAQALSGRPLTHHSEMPDSVVLEYPDWLDGPLRAAFGEALKQEMMALNQPAPVDLRSNLLKATWEEARAQLTSEHVETQLTPLSPLGLRLRGPTRLGGTTAYKSGMVEVQDEGSQLIAILTDARPGMTVVDFCAGAGGKTLALAAAMGVGGEVKGELIACDVFARRLERMSERLHRAGTRKVIRRVLSTESDPWVAENADRADRVLLDVPCTAIGTWRRSPEAKWRLSPGDLQDFVATQRRILASAARLVKAGGRLVYATCSLLREENEDQLQWFLENVPGFQALRIDQVWDEAVGGPSPPAGAVLRLSPAASGTDGFFCTILERQTE
jgi:16S rRNA (cytosine967-C5)-methyltransferase